MKVWEALKRKYSQPEYVLLAEVRNDAGFSASRSADGIAVSLWPSRGLHITGIEVKASPATSFAEFSLTANYHRSRK